MPEQGSEDTVMDVTDERAGDGTAEATSTGAATEGPRTEGLAPEALVEDVERAVREAALTACWEQWRSLGALAGGQGERRAASIVDPEALVLLSLLVRDEERRLDDFLGWWASTGAGLLSVQRAHNLAKQFPERARERLGAFARLAAEAGDRRWKRHQAEGGGFELAPREGKGAERPALYEPPALVLRLRSGFGVGTKADLLAFLLGLGGDRASTREAAEALAYTEVAVRAAAQEMALARFVEETPDRPALYAADPAAWAGVLGFTGAGDARKRGGAPPAWRYWAGVFAFLAGVLAWVEEGRGAEWSPYVWSSRARDLCERHRHALDTIRIRCPDGERHRGSAYLGAFAATVQEVAAWVPEHL
jgi:hypothetical protein